MDQIAQILTLIEDCKYLSAQEVFTSLSVEMAKEEPSKISPDDCVAIKAALDVHSVAIATMIERAKEIQATLNYEDTNANWILGANYFGVMTHYRKCAEDGSIVLKMEGVLDNLPLFEQCAVIHEIDLFKDWAPFCSESKTIEKFSAADLMA